MMSLYFFDSARFFRYDISYITATESVILRRVLHGFSMEIPKKELF